ncbi:hypothetical protein IWX49DRAFT_329968 [Phyllosticta citricarpa]|uniref:Uncharacterized protein n=2 Tax=Phyllosticta TaxID=121621 RepID=A0ABR1M756_9PEZI
MEKRDSRQSRCTTCHYPPPTSVDLPTDTTTDAAEVSAEWLLKPPRYPFGCRGAARLIHSAQVLLRLHAPARQTHAVFVSTRTWRRAANRSLYLPLTTQPVCFHGRLSRCCCSLTSLPAVVLLVSILCSSTRFCTRRACVTAGGWQLNGRRSPAAGVYATAAARAFSCAVIMQCNVLYIQLDQWDGEIEESGAEQAQTVATWLRACGGFWVAGSRGGGWHS